MRFRRILRSTVNALIVVAAIAAIVATLILPVLEIAGTSMEPSLNDGDIVLLMKTDKLETGDLCAFYFSNKILIKRVIGVPGDYYNKERLPSFAHILDGLLLRFPVVFPGNFRDGTIGGHQKANGTVFFHDFLGA